MLASTLQAGAQAQTQDTTIIEVGGYLWNKTTLNTLIVTSENQSWWSESYLNATLNAINDWNHAITYFAGNYSQYSYLSAVNAQVQVSNQTMPGFDIYINFSQSLTSGSQDSIGLTSTIPDENGSIQKVVISLGSQSQYLTFTEKDIQSVATHEFGHALGIGHSNSSTDLMYPEFDTYAAQIDISTLDVYGVANAFQWITNPSLTVPTAQQQLALPSGIPYEYIPATSPPPQSIGDNPVLRAIQIFGSILLTPWILLIIVVGVSLMILIEVYYRVKRRSRRNHNI